VQTGERADEKRRRSLADIVIVALATLLSLWFIGTLRDVALTVGPPAVLPAPPVPAWVKDRDADLAVEIVDEAGKPLPGASVRVFAMRDERAYFAGEHRTDEGGAARFSSLPRGEAWVLAYDSGRARASSRLILDKGGRALKLVLHPAKALDVIVVNEAGDPVPGALVRVTAGDPLPFVVAVNAEGRGRVDRLGPSPYQVRASAEGYDETIRTGVVPGPVPLRLKLERRGVLVVTVVGTDGARAPGATVLAAGPGLWPPRSTETDSSGQARIGALRSGVYDLKARLGDKVSETAFAVQVKNGEEKSLELRLGAGRFIRVTVTDGDGQDAPPVKEASVLVVEEGLSPFPLQGRTDEKGLVVLGPITMGTATASARATGFVPKSAVPIGEFETEVRVPLLRGGALIGDVVDDRGYPVAGATIEVVGVDAEGMPIAETSTMAEFREEQFDLLLPGPAPFIPMGELGVMPGPIPDLPREGAVVAVGGGDALGGSGGDPWVTRSDGTFRAEPVPPGRVHAIVRHPEYVEAISETVTIKSGGEATVHVVLRQGGLLEGRVIEEDRTPVAGARIELAATRGSLERVTYTADDGTFAFAAVPDEVLLSVARPEAPGDIVARLLVDIPDRDRKDVEIVLPKLREPVVIHVSDDRGYPIDRVEVRVVSLDVDVPLRRTLFTNDDGDAEVRDATGLPLRVTLLRPTKAPRIEHVERAPARLPVTLSEGMSAKGEVTGKSGRDRLEGAYVTLYTAAGVRTTRTDFEGAYTFEDLSPGRARLLVEHAEFASAEVAVTIAGDPDHPADLGTVDLAEAGEIEGVVLDPEEEPVAGARVGQGSVPTFLPLGPLPRGIVLTDRDGRFTLRGLPEGNATISAYTADLGRGFLDDVPVRAGRTTSGVKIELPGDPPAAREPKGAGSVAITLGERTEGKRRVVIVMSVPPGSEAELAGIEPGDRLIAVNGLDVRSIEDARRRLTGPLGEDVVVSLGREGGAPGSRDPAQTSWLTRVRRERVRR